MHRQRISDRRLAAVLVLLWTLVPSGQAQAQGATTTQIWTDFVLDHYFAPKDLLELEIGPKFLTSGNIDWSELTLTPAYEHSPNLRWDLVTRVLFSWVRQTQNLSTFEIRPVVGFRYYLTSKGAGRRVLVRDFNRIEIRSIYYQESSQRQTTARYRNRLEFQIALNNSLLTEDHTWYALLDAEIFVNIGQAAEETFNDNWRFRAGLGYRLKYAWRFEFLYTLQLTRDTLLADFDVSNHIFRTRIKYYF